MIDVEFVPDEPIDEEEVAKQYICNLTDTMPGLAEKMQGLTWDEIFQISNIPWAKK